VGHKIEEGSCPLAHLYIHSFDMYDLVQSTSLPSLNLSILMLLFPADLRDDFFGNKINRKFDGLNGRRGHYLFCSSSEMNF